MNDSDLKTLAHVYAELNSIRARDGAPVGVCPEYWDNLTERVRNLLESNDPRQVSAHCHPLLYKKYYELKD